MKRVALPIGLLIVAANVTGANTVRAVWCRRPPRDRGVAICSPLESPDPCDSPVGGKSVYTPYYQGYAPDRRCLPPMYGTVTSYAPTGPGFGAGALGSRPAPYGRSNFGAFSGASQDEAWLLHLGGFGPGAGSPSRPYQGDIIDRMQGR